MPYVNENDIVKCDVDALYSGEFPLDTATIGDAELLGYCEGSPYPAPTNGRATFLSGAMIDTIRQNPPGWDSVDRTCGD